MTAIITQKTKSLLMSQLKADADSASNKYYIGIGKSEDWNDSDTAISPVITEREERDFRLSMQSAKIASNYSFVIPRHPWLANTTFSAYDDNVVGHVSAQPFYTIIDNNQVYVCLRQSKSSGGTPNPSTVAPSGTSNVPFTTSDGYAWKFLYTVGVVDNTNFTTGNFIPVKKVGILDSDGSGGITSTSTDVQQIAIQDSAVAKPLVGFQITNGGAGYATAPLVTITGNGSGAYATATVSGNAVQKIEIKDSAGSLLGGTGYDYASVTFTALGGDTITDVATARVKHGPKAGFGADPTIDLRSSALMFNIQPDGTEDGEFQIGTSFRQLALMKNPADSTGVAFTATDGNALRRLELFQRTTGFTKGSLMTSASGAQGYVGHDSAAGGASGSYAELWFHQNETTGFKPFVAGEQVTDAAGGIGILDSATGIGHFNKSGKIDPFSGELLYIENRAKVVRAADQKEDIKVIIEI
jgi:hypothetical protein